MFPLDSGGQVADFQDWAIWVFSPPASGAEPEAAPPYQHGFAKKGDMVINLASMPVKESGMVNTLKISEI